MRPDEDLTTAFSFHTKLTLCVHTSFVSRLTAASFGVADDHPPKKCLVTKSRYANLHTHAPIAKHRNPEAFPDWLVVGHPDSELTDDFCRRFGDLPIRLWHMIGVDVCHMRPVQSDRVQHESDVIESSGDLCFNRNPRGVIECLWMPSALAG